MTSSPTVYDGITYDDYAALDGVRATDLKRLSISPRHYRLAEDSDTSSRKVLRAIHAAVLEPEAYAAEFTIFEGRRGTKAYKALEDANPGATLISESEAAGVEAVAASLHNHPLVGPYLTGEGFSELTVTWTHPATGLRCKARLDRIVRPSLVQATVLDLKTCGTTDARAVGSMAARMGWHLQLAHYVEGLRAAYTELVQVDAMIIAAEGKAPHDAALFRLAEDGALFAGQEERERLLALLAECKATDNWPGRQQGVEELTLPAWAYPDLDDEIHMGDAA